MASEAMSDERLAEINQLTADVIAGRICPRFDEETAWLAILDLRREVERLRADSVIPAGYFDTSKLLTEVKQLRRELFAAYELLDEHHIQR